MRKNILTIAAILATASVSAHAAGTTAFANYEFGRAEGGTGVQYEMIVGASQLTTVGTFDLGLKHNRFTSKDRSNGFEIGYSNGIRVGQVDLQGRVAYGRDNNIDAGGGGFTGNSQYWSVGAEASTPLTTDVRGFVGARHRNALNSDTPNQNRYTVGVDYSITKALTVRAGFAHYRQDRIKFNGVTTGVSYAF